MVLVAEQVSKRYGRREVLHGVSLSVKEGEVLGLLGHNGSGKTTLLALLSGMEGPDSGRIHLLENGQSVSLRPEIVACLLGKPAFYPDLSGLENLKVFGQLRGLQGHEFTRRYEPLMAEFGLSDAGHRKVKEYSEGMRQRLGLVRAVLHEPRVLLLDEPTNALDPEGFQLVRHFIVAQSKGMGRIVVLASHRLGEVEEVCDRVLLLNRGRCERYDFTCKLIDEMNSPFSLTASDPASALAILRERGCAGAALVESSVHFTCVRTQIPDLLQALLQGGVRVYELHRLSSGLELLFKQ